MTGLEHYVLAEELLTESAERHSREDPAWLWFAQAASTHATLALAAVKINCVMRKGDV